MNDNPVAIVAETDVLRLYKVEEGLATVDETLNKILQAVGPPTVKRNVWRGTSSGLIRGSVKVLGMALLTKEVGTATVSGAEADFVVDLPFSQHVLPLSRIPWLVASNGLTVTSDVPLSGIIVYEE